MKRDSIGESFHGDNNDDDDDDDDDEKEEEEKVHSRIPALQATGIPFLDLIRSKMRLRAANRGVSIL